ncbi:MAG: twin-arginine translocation signal domain-containing protein, partial [Planctomycetota bacterium]
MTHSDESDRSPGTTRRDFLKASTVTASAAVAGSLCISGSVFAAGSDIIRVGMIGCGGRNAGAAAQALIADSGTRLVAMCDIFMDRVKSKRQ